MEKERKTGKQEKRIKVRKVQAFINIKEKRLFKWVNKKELKNLKVSLKLNKE